MRRFTTRDEASGDFNLAEFLQEDPTTGERQELPYPRLSGGRFRQLRVDGATPAHGTLLSQWMSNDHGYVAPSALAGDAFALHPTKLSVAVARYLRVIAPADAALEDYAAEVANWVASTSRKIIGSSSAAVARVLRANSTTLLRGPWPPHARRSVDVLVERERALARVIDGAAAAPDLLPLEARVRARRSCVGISRPHRPRAGSTPPRSTSDQPRRPVTASPTPSPIIITPPVALRRSRRRGERPSQRRALPAKIPQAPSESSAISTQIAPSVRSWSVA